jgi:hypothetical protein
LKIGSDETKNPNEIEDNPKIEKEKNHEVELIEKESQSLNSKEVKARRSQKD